MPSRCDPVSTLNSLCQYFGYDFVLTVNTSDSLNICSAMVSPPLGYALTVGGRFTSNSSSLRVRYQSTVSFHSNPSIAKIKSCLKLILVGPVLFIHTNRNRDHIVHDFARIASRMNFANDIFYQLFPLEFPSRSCTPYFMICHVYNSHHGMLLHGNVEYVDPQFQTRVSIDDYRNFNVETTITVFPGIVKSVRTSDAIYAHYASRTQINNPVLYFLNYIDVLRQHYVVLSDSLSDELTPYDDDELDRRAEILLALSNDDVPDLLHESFDYEYISESSSDICSICFDVLSIENLPVRIPCTHIFHYSCITRWFLTTPTCPLCRYPHS